jgi:hypothetical protein
MELELLTGLTLDDVVKDIDAPDEIILAAVDVLSEMSRKIYEAKTLLQGRIIERMQRDNATKMPFVAQDGITKICTLKPGSMESKMPDADIYYKEQGFDPLEIGAYVYKPSWTKAKEMRKMGGVKQLAIDEIFKAGSPTLKIDAK